MELKLIIYTILIPIVKYYNKINSFNEIKYRLNDSTLLNNCKVIYLINDMSLLKPRNVKQIKPNKYIKAGTITFII